MSRDKEDVKAMADLLKHGATLIDLACPACNSPIFMLKDGVLWCVKCQKKVVVVKNGEQTVEPIAQPLYRNIESTLLDKLQEINEKIREENDEKELLKLNEVLSALLETLKKTRKTNI